MNNRKARFFIQCGLLALLMMLATAALAQHIRGALEGTIADQTGAVVTGAKVTIQNQATRVTNSMTTNERGYFNFQNLEAGAYSVTVEQSGFRKFVAKDVTINVGGVTPLSVALSIGSQEQLVEVTATSGDAAVDTSRSTVDGVITTKVIDNIPLNGRNFLDLAQLEPGVQVRDGGDFDPTKNQMVGVSVGGRSGRSTRVQVDGVDITDETVGTTTANISNETIQEFQVGRSGLDASTDLTSSGAINIVTRSGSNQIHGAGFGLFRDESFAADQRLGGTGPKPSFDRQIFGGRAGGFFIKDKWFWHVEYEQNNQDGQQFTAVGPFPQFNGNFGVPLDEHLAGARTDYNLTQNMKLFYRFGHNYNFGVTGFGGIDLSSFANLNNTNTHVTGIDFLTSRSTHSVRFSYLNFNNSIVDGNAAAGTPLTGDPAGNPLILSIQGVLSVGPDANAPQQTFQDNKQLKYDGSVVMGNHTFRFGPSYNRIDQAGFANFFGLAPRIRSTLASPVIGTGDSSDPLNYQLTEIVLGNGLGAGSEKPALGFPNGGFVNNRLGLYFTDTWKFKRNLTFNFGLRYIYDSGLSNSDLRRADIYSQFNPVLGNFVNNDNNNFAPQAGFAWDVKGNGKMVIRGGAGIYYDSNVFNNLLFDRALNLPPGLGNNTPVLDAQTPVLVNPGTGDCLFDIRNFVSTPGQCTAAGGVNLLGQPLRNVIVPAQLMQSTLQGISAALASNFSPSVGDPLIAQTLDTQNGAIFPGYKRPYSAMMNIGFQYELKPGLVLSADFLRNRGVHFGQVTDLNRLGAANTLNVATASAAMAAFHASIGCPANSSIAAVQCAINSGQPDPDNPTGPRLPVTILDYAAAGLDGGSALNGAAFQGVNPNFRTLGFIQPLGLSTYNALTVSLRGRLGNYGVLGNLSGIVSYSLSRFKSTSGDQDFTSNASVFNDAPTRFFGPTALDRTHQFSMGLLVELPRGFRVNTTTRLMSSLAQSALLPRVSGLGEIFFTDFDGDGTVGDPLPGTNRGAFGRGLSNGAALNNLINQFNQQVSNMALTPAAQALVSAGLFTETQLRDLGAFYNNGSLVDLAADQGGLDTFSNTDVRFSWTYKVRERVSIQPMIEVFNIFNVANYDAPGNVLSNLLDGSDGSINRFSGTRINRYGLGSGSFAPGIPRSFQLGFRVEF